MSRNYQQTNGKDLPDFPSEVALAPVSIWIHDSGMIVTHDYSCPVCNEQPAVYHTGTGIFQPCWDCDKTHTTIKKKQPKNFIQRLISRITD